MAERILITGASGIIGRAVATALLEQGRQVRALSRDPRQLSGIFRDTAPMPLPGAGPEAWMPALAGIGDVIHCAGVAETEMRDENMLRAANTGLTCDLATAAARYIEGKLIFLSSVRALGDTRHLDGAPPRDAYGRSKLEAEKCVRDAFAQSGRFTILRPVPVYSVQMKGNLRRLLRIAAMPVPLPLKGLAARKSLLDLDACVRAILHVLTSCETDGQTYLVSDEGALTVAEIVGALRNGLGRRPLLFHLPAPLLGPVVSLAGRTAWESLSESLEADARELASTGWRPERETAAGLTRIAAEIHRRSSP